MNSQGLKLLFVSFRDIRDLSFRNLTYSKFDLSKNERTEFFTNNRVNVFLLTEILDRFRYFSEILRSNNFTCQNL